MSSDLTLQKVFHPASDDITDWENEEERSSFIKMSHVLEICTLGIPHAVYSACKNFQENNKVDQLAKTQLYQHPESALIEILAANFPESEKEGIINVLKDDSIPFTPFICAKLLPIIKEHLTKNAQDQEVWNGIHSRKFNGPSVACQIGEVKKYQLPLSLLIAQSTIFANAFEGYGDCLSQEVILPNILYRTPISSQIQESFYLLLGAHGGNAGLKGEGIRGVVNKENALSLYKLADFYDVKWLLDELSDYLSSNFNALYIYHMLDFSMFYETDLPELLEWKNNPDKKLKNYKIHNAMEFPHKRLYLECIKELANPEASLYCAHELYTLMKKMNGQKDRVLNICQEKNVKYAQAWLLVQKAIFKNIKSLECNEDKNFRTAILIHLLNSVDKSKRKEGYEKQVEELFNKYEKNSKIIKELKSRDQSEMSADQVNQMRIDKKCLSQEIGHFSLKYDRLIYSREDSSSSD